MNNLFDIVIPVGPKDQNIISRQMKFTQKNIVNYRNIYLVCNDSNFKLKDWMQKVIVFEFLHAARNGYLFLLITSYIKVFSNIHNVYSSRHERYLNMKKAIKVIKFSSLK